MNLLEYVTFEYNVDDCSIFNGVLISERDQHILTIVLKQQQLVQQVTIWMLRELCYMCVCVHCSKQSQTHLQRTCNLILKRPTIVFA